MAITDTAYGMDMHPAFSRQEIPGYRVRVRLVACGQEKQTEPSLARDFYTGDLTRKMIAAMELGEWDAGSPADGTPWFVASGHYGLTDPDEVCFPYDASVCRMSRSERAAWGERVAAELLAICPGESLDVEIYAGRVYADALRPALEAAGARVTVAMVGAQVGERKQALKQAAEAHAAWVARWAALPREVGPMTPEAWAAAQWERGAAPARQTRRTEMMVQKDGSMVDESELRPRAWVVSGEATNGRTISFEVTATTEDKAIREGMKRAILDNMRAVQA